MTHRGPPRGSSRAILVLQGLLILLVLGHPAALTGQDLSDLPATAASGRTLLSGCEFDYPPFSLVDPEGEADGFAVELLRAVVRSMGRNITFATGPWAEVKDLLESGRIDVLPIVARTPQREEAFDFTFPYLSMHGAIVVHDRTSGLETLADLQEGRVGVMLGDIAEEFLRGARPDLDLVTTPTFRDALELLSAGQCDAVVMQRLVALRLLQQSDLPGLRVLNRPIDDFRQDFCFAVHEGDRETLSLLNEGLALAMADGTFRKLYLKWFAPLELPTHRRLVFGGDDDFPPYEFLDERGRPAGYNVELSRAIANEMGLDIEIRLGPWQDTRRELLNGEIDAVQGMLYSLARDQEFDFSPAHTVLQYVGVGRRGAGPPPASLADLAGLRLAVQGGDLMHDLILAHELQAMTAVVSSQEEALLALIAGEVDAALVNRATALGLIARHGWDDLELARRALVAPEYCYAVTPNQQALLAQINEGLKILQETGQYRRIHQKWLGVYEEPPTTLTAILRPLAMITVPLLLIIAATIVWSWSLRRQVAHRTLEVQRREAQFFSLVEGAPDAIFVQTDFRFAYLNPAGYKLFGAGCREDLVGQPVLDRFHASVHGAVRERIRLLNTLKQSVPQIEVTYLRMDGSPIPVEVSAVPIHYEGQDGALVFVRDITERKVTEDALRRSEEGFRTLYENAPFMINSFDSRGHCLLWNRECEKVLGWTQAEVAAQAEPLKLFYRDPEVLAAVVDSITTPPFKVFREWHPVAKDGRILATLWANFTLPDGSLISIGQDITEHRQAEAEREKLQAQLTQAQKLESVGRLAGGVAHDFNNMLGVILGYAELAMERIEPDHPLRADLEQINKAAQHSADITRQLLAFARQQTIAPRVLDLNATVEGMLRMLRRLIGEDTELVWRPRASLPAVKMDPVQIDQLLANLCVNARDAIQGSGSITIETDLVVLDAAFCTENPGFKSGEYILLAVGDDGCGMDVETLNRVFEPFFTTKDLNEGTGLGLPMIYGVVKQNHGFIKIDSAPGQGTRVEVYLPPHEAEIEVAESRPSRAKAPVARGETILVVEDEEAILELTCKILERLGYTVLGAESPGQALRLAAEHPGEIHLLLSDVVMPELNGRELSRRLLVDRPALVSLFMSGYTADVIANQGVLDDGIQFLQKPFNLETLAAKVREALDQGQGG